MDTRTKIVNAEEAARIASAGAIVVSGYFDPMVASHAQRFSDLKSETAPLLVLIATPPNPILDAGARAALVAGLGVVDYVAVATSGLVPQIRFEEEDQALFTRLIEHVHARQQAAS